MEYESRLQTLEDRISNDFIKSNCHFGYDLITLYLSLNLIIIKEAII